MRAMRGSDGSRSASAPAAGAACWASEFTFERARALAGAVAALARPRARRGAPVLVGHDTRFLAEHAAAEVADALAAAGATVSRSRAGAVPTPASCRAVWRRRLLRPASS